MDKSSALIINHPQIKTLSKNLRYLLKARGVSESEIAQSLSLPVMTVRRIVSGETTDPRVSTLKLLADYFNVSVDSLIEESSEEKPFHFAEGKIPRFVPILDWKTIANIQSIKDIDYKTWENWHPVTLGKNLSLGNSAFALESRPSMQPRFPLGTLFIIDPDESPIDGDIILIKMKSDGNISLRDLIIDLPKWQLQPIIAGSEVLFYDDKQHQIMGIVILSMLLHTRK